MSEQEGQPVAKLEPEPFHFKLVVGEDGVSSMEYGKNASMLFGTLIGACRVINDNFDNPLPSAGDFLRYLAQAADEMDAENGKKADAQKDGQSTAA